MTMEKMGDGMKLGEEEGWRNRAGVLSDGKRKEDTMQRTSFSSRQQENV